MGILLEDSVSVHEAAWMEQMTEHVSEMPLVGVTGNRKGVGLVWVLALASADATELLRVPVWA